MTSPNLNREELTGYTMGRTQEKIDKVDYFPHFCRPSKSLRIIDRRYDNEGYSFWWRLLERLGDSNGHFIDLADVVEIQYLADETHLDKNKIIEILSYMSTLGMIDKNLYDNHKIIWSDNLVINLGEVYRKRKRSAPTRPFLKNETEQKVSDLTIACEDSRQPAETIPKLDVASAQLNAASQSVSAASHHPDAASQSGSAASQAESADSRQRREEKSKEEKRKEEKRNPPTPPPIGAPFFNGFKKPVVINGKTIPDFFLIGLITKCQNDLFEVGRILYRSRKAGDPMSYIKKGIECGYILKPTEEESTKSAEVKAWIDNLLKGG